MNPLLDFSGLPRFDLIQPAHVGEALTRLLAENRALIEQLTQDPTAPTWENFIAPLTDAHEKLSRAWGIVGHLHGVKDVPEWREAYNAHLADVTRYYSELGQNIALYEKTRALKQSPAYAALDDAKKRVIDFDLRDYRLSGAELPEETKPRFQAIQERLAALGAKFSENLLDATNAHAEWVTEAADLAGLPEDIRQAARAAAEKDGKSGWKFTLQAPSYIPLMQYADNRALRQRAYRAYATRASETGPSEWDNTPLIAEILSLRDEAARMLGFESYACLSLVPKMADSAEEVDAFLAELAAKARPHAERDLAELKAFARDVLGLESLEAWDIAYCSEKLRQARYAFSEQEVKQYFPEPRVLNGLFRVIEALYGVSIYPDQAPRWHPDVRFFSIHREGRLIGQFYLDLYAREEKRSGAWMDEAITRRRLGDRVQTPVAYLNCNFPAPLEGQSAVFPHDDVITLFHECGHGLHHLLTEVDELAVSGIHGVEWDAVELPSQFMENFCWEWDVLRGMTGHVETGEPLPRALFDKMVAAKNFHSGLAMLRQLEFSLFDIRLHHHTGRGRPALDILNEVRRDIAVLSPPAWNRFPQSFSHIFAGGYAAGYYSYKWAEVLSADAFSAFEEAAKSRGSVLDRTLGEQFLKEVLSVGGSRPAADSFKAFRGRPPEVDALLRHNGMAS
jgi:oligopeptidase A